MSPALKIKTYIKLDLTVIVLEQKKSKTGVQKQEPRKQDFLF